jgi:SAM-dependent methyltransferase
MNTNPPPPDGRSPAEIYEQCFVPALFQQWGPVIADAAAIGPGQRVLDVACGTGVLACAAAERVGPEGAVTGLDANPQMLEVARRKRPDVEWVDGRAERLPFPDGHFDAVVSQFGFMFFDDRVGGLREMMRVLRPGGRLAVAVCDALAQSPGYAAFATVLRKLFGDAVSGAFRAPFALGDAALLSALCDEAGIRGARITQRAGSVRFASIDALISTERACVWTLGGLLDDAQFERLRAASDIALRPFVGSAGLVEFAMPALVITATSPPLSPGRAAP